MEVEGVLQDIEVHPSRFLAQEAGQMWKELPRSCDSLMTKGAGDVAE